MKAKMPEPVAYIRSSSMLNPSPRCVSLLDYVSQIDKDRGEPYEAVITTAQAEAYADAARVREALEEAASIAERMHEDAAPYWVAAHIRFLIPKEAKS